MNESVSHVILCIHKVVCVYPLKVYGGRDIAALILTVSSTEGEY